MDISSIDISKDKSLSNLISDCSDPMFFCNPSLGIQWLNKSAESLFNEYSTLRQEVELKIKNLNPDHEKIRTIDVIFPTDKNLLMNLYATSTEGRCGYLGRLDCRELSEKRASRLQLEIINQKNALDQAAVVAITDPAGLIIYVNEKFVKLSGYSSDELIGYSHRIINSNFHPPEFFRNLWKTISRGEVWHGELRNKKKNGDYYWVDTTIVPFKNELGQIYCYVSIRFDITDRINQLKQIEDDKLRLVHAEKMASLGELAAGIAHEIGNPLASISAWLEVLSSAIRSGKVEDLSFSSTLTNVREKVDRMSKILIGMLSYARDGSKDPETSVNLSLLVRNVLDYCSLKIRNCGITVSIRNFPEYVSYHCREAEISQVLVNLILNSCDAICDNDIRWIEIRYHENDNAIIISIVDSGLGIPEPIVGQIMKPFFTTKKIGRGTGLGLSISTKILEAMGGNLKLDRNSPNTKFDICLPKDLPQKSTRDKQ